MANNKMLLSVNDKGYSIRARKQEHETKMTSDIAPAPFVASSSGVYSATYPAWRAFNGTNVNASDCWMTVNGTSTGWAQIDYGKRKEANKVAVTSRYGTDNGSSPRNFNILGSNDGVNFQIVAQITNQTGWASNQTREFDFDIVGDYRYFRLQILQNNGLASYCTIGKIQFSFDGIVLEEIPSLNDENFIEYGQPELNGLNGVMIDKKYILQDKDEDSLLKVKLDRKPTKISLA